MAKLSTLSSGLATIGSRLNPTTSTNDREQDRSISEPWRAWYKTAQWQRLRWSVLVRDSFTCQWNGCGKTTHHTSELVAHHKLRHRGNPVLFWDAANLMTVCTECHEGPIKAAERSFR